MIKPHINDTFIFVMARYDIGAYKALTLTCKILKALEDGK